MVWLPKLAYFSLALLSAATAQAGNMYCCQDPSTNRRYCGDGLPEQCRGKAYKVLDSNGNLIKEVAAPLTAEQKALVAVEAQRKKEQEAALKEQRRKDQALLDTYSNVQDIERARSRSESDTQEAIKQAEAKLATLKKQRKKFEDELEFYRNKTVPPEVNKGLRDIDSDNKATLSLIDAKKAELEAIRTKYDEDKRRYLQLTGSR